MQEKSDSYDSDKEEKLEHHDAHAQHKPGEKSVDYLDHELPPTGSDERTRMEKRLVRRLDFRLLPMISFIYIVNYIDVSRRPPFACLLQLFITRL